MKFTFLIAALALSVGAMAQEFTLLKNFDTSDYKAGFNFPIVRAGKAGAGLFAGVDGRTISDISAYGWNGRPFDRLFFGPSFSYQLGSQTSFVVAYSGTASTWELPKNNTWSYGFSVRF
jgi:hypothetical protein